MSEAVSAAALQLWRWWPRYRLKRKRVLVVLPFGCKKRATAFKQVVDFGTVHKSYWEVQGIGRLEILYALGAPASVLDAVRQVEREIAAGASKYTVLKAEEALWNTLVEELRK
jgi:hypothetical protein